jgi:hypothetical protein
MYEYIFLVLKVSGTDREDANQGSQQASNCWWLLNISKWVSVCNLEWGLVST